MTELEQRASLDSNRPATKFNLKFLTSVYKPLNGNTRMKVYFFTFEIGSVNFNVQDKAFPSRPPSKLLKLGIPDDKFEADLETCDNAGSSLIICVNHLPSIWQDYGKLYTVHFHPCSFVENPPFLKI